MAKINRLEIENVKRVKAVKIEPTANGLTVIGGNNGQGKTSVLDSIAWALGGNKFKPSDAAREGSMIPPFLHIVMDNGLIVERKGKNSDLKVIDPDGNKAGQNLLDTFGEELALNLPKFMNSSNKEKANTLLQIIGVGEQLVALEKEEQDTYNKRHAIGQIADQKEKFAKEQDYYSEAPKDLVSASELIKEQQGILAKNGENQKKRQNLVSIQKMHDAAVDKVERLKRELSEAETELAKAISDLVTANKSVENLVDESTAELEKNIQEIDDINRKVRANLDKEKAEEDAREYRTQYDSLSTELKDIRQKKTDLLLNADLPLPGLSVEDGDLTYNGFKWDNMSGSDQLKVATAIVRKLNPQCGFVLLDKLEQMDQESLKEFGNWLEAEGLQAIATRVSTGEECSIIIEDGYIKNSENYSEAVTDTEGSWKF